MSFGLEAYVLLAAALFSLGLYGAVSKKGAVLVLMSLELMAIGVDVNLLAFSRFVSPSEMTGQFFAIFVMVVSAAEIGLGLALVLAIFKRSQSAEVTELSELKG